MTLRQIDDAMLDRAQPISDWVHDWTGLDAIHQERILCAASAICWLLSIVFELREQKRFDWIAGMLVLWLMYRAFFEDESDSVRRSHGDTAIANPKRWRTHYMVARLFSVVFGGSLSLVSIANGNALWAAIGIIVPMRELAEALDVQTPRIGRIRQGLRDMGAALVMRGGQPCKN